MPFYWKNIWGRHTVQFENLAILNKQKCLLFKNREQEGKTCPDWGLAPVCLGGGREGGRCGERV
jgi:hypothetical protein